jgi:hypothetical protein
MWTDLLDLPGCLDTAYTGHNEIHDYHVRSEFRSHAHSLLTGICLTNHIEIRL